MIVSTDCSGEKQDDRADLQDVEEHRALNAQAPDLRHDAGAAGKQVPGHHGDADRIGDQRAGRDAAHAELRDRPEAEAERAAEHDLAHRGIEDHQRRQLHVAGAAQNRRPSCSSATAARRRRKKSAHSRPPAPARCRGRPAAPAAMGPKISMPSMKTRPKQIADQQRMRRQRRGALVIAGAERARDRRRHAAAHRAARHGHGQDHEGKHQRHRGQRLDAEPADIGGLRDHHAGAGA